MESASPKPQIEGHCGSWSSSEPTECFEGISPEEVKIMMMQMKSLASTTEKKREAFPVQPGRLRLRTLLIQADVANSCFERLGAVECIVKAVECRRQVLSLVPDGHVARRHHLATFGGSLLQKFMLLGDLADINQAIQCLSQEMPLTPDGHLNEPGWLNNLGRSYMLRFDCLGEPADMVKAIECQTQLVQLTPDSHPDKPGRLQNLGNSYQYRFDWLGELTDVEKAIEHQTQAVQLAPNSHPDKPGWLNNLGISHMRRFQRLGELADVEKAIECLNQAVKPNPGGHSDRPGWLDNLGTSCNFRFKRLGDLTDLEKAIECHAQAVQLTTDGHPDKPGRLNNLGNSYQSRFEWLGELADVEKAIECQTQATQLTPDGHPDKPCWLNNLGNSYQSRFEHLGKLADVEKAIDCYTQAVQLTPNGHPDKPVWLNNLGSSYRLRFKHLDELADVQKAMECHTQAVQSTPNGHVDKSKHLQSLGNSYMSRFKRLLADLEKAIERHTQAVQLTLAGHPDRPGRLNNLGNSYRSRFKVLGELLDLEKAIECHTQAVQLAPDDCPDRLISLDSLGSSYMRRFERLGELADVDEAIECQTEVVRATPDGHLQRPGRLNNLGISYQFRFRRLCELADVEKAIECHTQAVQLIPDGHRDRPDWLNSLGNAYMLRFQCLDEHADLEKAIEYQTQAMQLTSNGHLDRQGLLNNLGISHQSRFKRLGKLADVEKAIECYTQAVQLTPDGYPNKPGLLGNLGTSYQSRFEILGEFADLTNAHSIFQQAAQLVVTSPESQLRCTRNWAKASSLLGLSPHDAYNRCFELLPHLVWLGTTIIHRYGLLTKVNDLATEAASWAISIESYDLAIEWLEEGRSIVWNQILHLRTPLDHLSTIDPHLAQHLKDIACQLEQAETVAQQHRQLAAEWEHCLKKAHSIPGFHNFMQPRSAAELKAAAIDGPVVIINTHFTRWDALVIFPQCNDVVHVPLGKPPLHKAGGSQAQPYSGCMVGHRGERGRGFGRLKQGPEPEDSFKAALVALWFELVKPILDALGYMRKMSVSELPHVTWCATGLLASIPLHAAGPYDGLSPNAFDLVVSSYTPSLSALLASSVASAQPQVGLLAVGQEHTMGLCPLPNTVQELELIKTHAHRTCFLVLNGENASVDAVLKAMDCHSWVHLACHATQNPVNPTHSAFHLSDGDLTLESITKCQFKNKGLAFLSACQTAKGDSELPDEVVHLAAGMLMAGYPSVIATMWSIWDTDGPEVAGQVYAELLEDGKMDHRGAARALHKAVAGLREKIGEDKFEQWVPFIHIGV